MDVKLPDGTIIRNVPEGTTKAQLMAKLGQSGKWRNPGTGIGWLDKSLSTVNEALLGGVEAAANLGSDIEKLPGFNPIRQIATMTPGGRKAIEGMEGQRDRLIREGIDTASRYTVSRPSSTARTVGRIGTTLALPGPKGLTRIPAAIGRAAQGAAGGAASRDPGTDATTPATVGAVANVVLPPVLSRIVASRPVQAIAQPVARAAAPTVNWLGAKAEDLAELIGIRVPSLPRVATPAAEEAASRPLAPLGRKAEARAARFEKVGVQPTTGMVTRNPTAFKTERKLAQMEGVGEDLSSQIQDVEQGLVAAGRKLVDKMGGAKGAESTGKSASEVLETKQGEMQAVTGRLYDKVRDARGEEGIGNLETLRRSFDESELADNPVFEDMTAAIGKRLGRYAERDEGAVGITLRQAEELRKFIGKLGNSSDGTARLARKQLIDALDDDVVAAVGDDAFKAARESAKARFQEFSKTVAGRIADEGIPAEKLTQRLLSMSLDDLRSVKKSYLTGTDEQIARGTEAWKDLQAQGVDDLLKGAISEEGAISGTKLLNNFRTRSGNLRVLLDPADYKQLRRLVLASRDATVSPPSSSAYGSDTAPMLSNLLQDAKPAVREGWAKYLAKHGLAGLISFPAGNVAMEVGSRAAASAAQQKAANALMRRVELARSPEATAKAVEALRKAASTNPAASALLDKLGLAGSGAIASESQ